VKIESWKKALTGSSEEEQLHCLPWNASGMMLSKSSHLKLGFQVDF
jgi:hypothetical protein